MGAAAALALGLPQPVLSQTHYSTTILQDAPLLYWNFDEANPGDPAEQLAPVAAVPVTTENDLVPVAGATRATHADTGGLPRLGRAASLNGANFFRSGGFRLSQSSLDGPWAIEFWMKAEGGNAAGTGDRQDYLLNFGNPGADNRPSFIFDYEPDTLEAIGGGRTTDSPAVTDTAWHHVLWVFYGDGGIGVADRFDLWVDGVNHGNVRDAFSHPLPLHQQVLVGAALPDGVGGFEGQLDELAIYDLGSLLDEAAVEAKAAALAGNFASGSAGAGTYASTVLAHGPLLYWNFDEADGSALQRAPLAAPPAPDNALNQLIPQGEATRLSHADIGSGFQLGMALELRGADYFEALDLDAGVESVGAPWIVEFWMQAGGDNSGNRADYLLNFGPIPGGDNAPAFIYDFKPDQLEAYMAGGRTNDGPLISDGGWHHVVWAYYGNGAAGVGDAVEVFIDGVTLGRNVRNDFGRAINVSGSLLVGAALPGGVNGFEGRLDEVAVYRLAGVADEAAARTRAAALASSHYLAAFGPPTGATVTITRQPDDATALKGGAASFTVAATVGGAPLNSLTYQWLRNGSPIAGATGVTHVTPALGLADLGTSTYSVRVSTVGGVFVLSRGAVLTVPVPPATPTHYAGQVLADQPFLYWNFDENAGPAVQQAPLSAPVITTGNELVPMNGAARGPSLGKLGSAASFDGFSYFELPALAAGTASLAGPWAVEFWMRVDGDNSGERQDYLLNLGNTGADNAPAFIYDFKPDQLEAFHGPRTDNGPIINDAQWHHVLWVFYGNEATGVADRMDAWLDGVNLGNVRATFSRTLKLNERLLVGAALPDGVNGFEGSMDEIAIYDLGGLADEAAVTSRAQVLATHFAAATSAEAQAYADVVLSHQPTLYWNFDEADGNALQLAPIVPAPPDNSQNDLAPVAGAGRVEHAQAGGLYLGNAADFDGDNFFRAVSLTSGRAALSPPWAVEFWMQVQGDNSDERQDYLLNFGTSPGGDNGPAFIYDYNADQLEVFHGPRTADGPLVSDDQWHHVVWVYYGDEATGVADRMDAWLDGVNLGNVRNDFGRSIKVNELLLVGAALQTGIGGFEGRLDELAVYDLARFTTEASVETHLQGLVARHRTAALNPPPAALPPLVITQNGNQITISWSGAGPVLQQSSTLAGWTDVPGGAASPVTITLAPGTPANFYRLRQ